MKLIILFDFCSRLGVRDLFNFRGAFREQTLLASFNILFVWIVYKYNQANISRVFSVTCFTYVQPNFFIHPLISDSPLSASP